jgi:hypothetical protein
VANSLIPNGIKALIRKIQLFVSIVAPFCGKYGDSKGLDGFVLQKRGVFNFLGNLRLNK